MSPRSAPLTSFQRAPRKLLSTLRHDQRGGGFVEYAILIGLVALVGFAAYEKLGTNVKDGVKAVNTKVSTLPKTTTAE
jgi:Flp pilus assembly pilin Flp